MRRIFVDSGAWIALAVQDDRKHREAVAFHSGSRAPLLTTNYVVAETVTHLRYDHSLRVAQLFRRAILGSQAEGRLTVRWIDERLERDGWDVLERFADVALSLTDATSAAVARRAKCLDVFGFDSDFRALGFNLKP